MRGGVVGKIRGGLLEWAKVETVGALKRNYRGDDGEVSPKNYKEMRGIKVEKNGVGGMGLEEIREGGVK